MKIKKSAAIGLIVLAFTSLILITGSPFQIATNLVENNGHLYIKNIGQEVYASDDNGGGGDDGGGDDGGGDDGGGDDGGGDDGGGDDGGGDSGDSGDGGVDGNNGGSYDGSSNDDSGGYDESGDSDSEDSSSVGEDFYDGSGSGDGSDEPTSTPVEDDTSNDAADVDSSPSEFFSASDEPTSTPVEDDTSNDAADVDSSPSEFFSASDEPTSTPDNSQPNLRTLSNPPIEEPSLSAETDAVEEQEAREKVNEAPETSFSLNPEGAAIAPISNPNGEIKDWGNTVEATEVKAEEEDDETTNKALDEENDGWYGGPKDSEGNLLDREDWPADAEYDNEDEIGQLKVDEKGFREYLKDRDIDLDTDYYKYSPDEKKKMEEEYEEQKEDKYRDITTAGEDVEGFERFVEEKKGNDYNFEKDYHWESAEDQSKLEKEFNDMKLKRAGEDLKPSEQIPIKGGPVKVEVDKKAAEKQICEDDYDSKWKNDKCNFSKEDQKTDQDGDYEHRLADEGLYDDYYKRTTSKEDREKIEKENQKYLAGDSDDKGKNDNNNDKWKKIHITHKVKVINKNKIVVQDYDGTQKQIIVVSDVNTCPTQSETVPLIGKLNPKGIRLLADFGPCKIKNGGVTLNIPDTQNIKLAALFMDKTSSNNYGILINPTKIQKINTNQALFTIQLDGEMTGKSPITGKTNTLTKINGLALYNSGANTINLNAGNMAALTATLSK